MFQQLWVIFDSFAKASSYSNEYFCVNLFVLNSKAWSRGTIKDLLQKIILVWDAVFWVLHLVQIAMPHCQKAYWNCYLKKAIFRIYWEHFEWIKSFETNGPIVLNYRMSKSWVCCPKIICILLLFYFLPECKRTHWVDANLWKSNR